MNATNGVATVAAATGSATAFKLADVRAVWAALPPAYEPNATWLMSPSAFASLANLTDTAGGLVLPTLHNDNPTLYARPVLVSPELPAAAANARSVVVGDFSVGYALRRVPRPGDAPADRDSLQLRADRLQAVRADRRPGGTGGRAPDPCPFGHLAMLGWLRRRQRSRRRPTPDQAFLALSEARCMYSPLTNCTGRPKSAGLRGDFDDDAILVCKAHYGRLRKLDARQADELARQLRQLFGRKLAA